VTSSKAALRVLAQHSSIWRGPPLRIGKLRAARGFWKIIDISRPPQIAHLALVGLRRSRPERGGGKVAEESDRDLRRMAPSAIEEWHDGKTRGHRLEEP